MSTAISSLRTSSLLLMIFCALVLALLVPGQPPSAGEIYKSVDSKGRVVYSDRPSKSAERVVLPPPSKSTQAERQRITAQMEALARAEAERASKTAAEQKEKIEKKEAEEHKKELCKRARDRYLTFAEARRPYRRDEQGNRVYYSSDEINAERAAAEKEMDAQCTSE